MASVPNFASLVEAFPYKPAALTPGRTGPIPAGTVIATNKELVEMVGGDLQKQLAAIYPDLDQMNTCAIRLSFCLNRCASKVTPMAGVRMFSGADRENYAIRADEMIAYLKNRYGRPVLVFDGAKSGDAKWIAPVTAPAQGIFGYDWQGRFADFGAGGHVDIGKLPSKDVRQITQVGTAQYFKEGPMKVFFWASA